MQNPSFFIIFSHNFYFFLKLGINGINPNSSLFKIFRAITERIYISPAITIANIIAIFSINIPFKKK